jgi:hypothetical protein
MTAHAQHYKPVVETKSLDALRGVEAVRVLVETTPLAEQRGVTAARLEAGAVERLRKAGLRALTGEEAKLAKGQPIFFIKVLLFDTTTNYSYTFDVQLRETVRLTRPPATEMMAATWQNAGHGLLTTRDTERVLEGMFSFVDFFVREYQTANGR